MTTTGESLLSDRTLACYSELAGRLADRHRATGLQVLGINGAQGSGKSRLARFLAQRLSSDHGLAVVVLSLDDFYLSRAARAGLAADVHPLLATRGVPGTHDVNRGIDCLLRLKAGRDCRLPRFSKADDDPLPAEREHRVVGPVDLILFEGWCVGTPPQPDAALIEPVNALEREEDRDGVWRRYVNDQLVGPYARWFSLIDTLVFLAVPGWAQVREWRGQQERETAAARGGGTPLLDPDRLERFLQHYLRLSLHALATLPSKADLVLALDPDHSVRWAHSPV